MKERKEIKPWLKSKHKAILITTISWIGLGIISLIIYLLWSKIQPYLEAVFIALMIIAVSCFVIYGSYIIILNNIKEKRHE